MLSQLGIFTSMVAMALTSSDASLALTALFAVLLAFWTTTLEVAADAWRIELAPTQEQQGPIAAANLWGYRTAMVAAGSGALLFADADGSSRRRCGAGHRPGWTAAYLLIAVAAFLPLPILAALPRQPDGTTPAGGERAGRPASARARRSCSRCGGGRGGRLGRAGGRRPASASAPRPTSRPGCSAIAMLPFLAMAAALPRIRRAAADSPLRAVGGDRAVCRFLLALWLGWRSR